MLTSRTPRRARGEQEGRAAIQGALRNGNDGPKHHLHGNPPVRSDLLRHKLGWKLAATRNAIPEDAISVVVVLITVSGWSV